MAASSNRSSSTVTIPLKLYYSDARGDNFTTATAAGERDARAAGYRYARTECFLLAAQEGETVPLKLYYSDARGDNFTTATSDGERDARAAGYRYVRVEGYLFPEQRSGLVPLKLYYSDARHDNFTTATAEGERDARAAGYRYVRVEGYVYPATASQDVSRGESASTIDLTGSWSVTIQSTGDELQGDWTRTDVWEFSSLGDNRWRVKMTIGRGRSDRRGELSGEMVDRTKSYEDVYSTIDDGNGRFRLVVPDPRGGQIEMAGTFSRSHFSVSDSSGNVHYSYDGTRQ